MNENFEALLNEHEVARLLHVSVATMRRRRLFRQPPEFLKIGASVRYRPEAVKRLIESSEYNATKPQAATTAPRMVQNTRRRAGKNAR